MQGSSHVPTPEGPHPLRHSAGRDPDSVLAQPYFLNYWTSRTLSSLSFQMLTVAIGWQMYAVTHSAFSLGFVGLAEFLPMVLLTLVVGQVADRIDRRVITAMAQITEGTVAALLLVANLITVLGRTEILIAAALFGASRAFDGPASSALLPQLVRRDVLQQAIAWSTSGGQMAAIVGPAVGGLLFSLGSTWVYGAAAAALLTGGTLIALIRLANTARPARNTRGGVTLESVLSGLVFVYRHPVILGTISLDLFAVLLGGATALLPIYAQSILHTGPWGLGLMRTAPAVGALLISGGLARFPLRRAFSPALFGALGVFGVATMVFAVSKSLWLAILALAFVGGSDVISVVIRSSLVQLQTPDDMRGRVNAVNSLFIGTSNQLGEFESGMVAGFVGAEGAALIGGIGTLVIAGLWMMLFPSLRRIRSLSES